MALIGKTFDELDSFVGDPSLSSYIAIRDMTVASNNTGATKKFTIADLIILIHSLREILIAEVSLTANNPITVTFPDAFAAAPGVGILRTVDSGGAHVGIAVTITDIGLTSFVATAIEDCTMTYIAGKIIT